MQILVEHILDKMYVHIMCLNHSYVINTIESLKISIKRKNVLKRDGKKSNLEVCFTFKTNSGIIKLE